MNIVEDDDVSSSESEIDFSEFKKRTIKKKKIRNPDYIPLQSQLLTPKELIYVKKFGKSFLTVWGGNWHTGGSHTKYERLSSMGGSYLQNMYTDAFIRVLSAIVHVDQELGFMDASKLACNKVYTVPIKMYEHAMNNVSKFLNEHAMNFDATFLYNHRPLMRYLIGAWDTLVLFGEHNLISTRTRRKEYTDTFIRGINEFIYM